MQHLDHLGFEGRITPLQVILNLVRSHRIRRQNFGHRAPYHFSQLGVPRLRTMFLDIFGEQASGPQLLGISPSLSPDLLSNLTG